LFCFPYAGGGVSSYLPWQAALGSDVEVLAVQLPGRGARLLEPGIDSFPVLVDSLTSLVAAHADWPFALFGHSLGALMAFEVTRALRTRCLPGPTLLIVSACEAPHDRPDVRRLHELDDEALTKALADLNGTACGSLGLLQDSIHGLHEGI
jgi:medium-chain acyl-[acyl-carrier-protein] hydrolase